MEAPECGVVLGELALALENVDLDGRLVVGGCREGLRATCGNRGVALDHGGHHATEGLDAERQGRYIEQEDVGHALVADDDAGLQGSADGNGLIWVDSPEGGLADLLLDHLLNDWDSSGASDEEDLVDFSLFDSGVLHCLAGRANGPGYEIANQILELGS